MQTYAECDQRVKHNRKVLGEIKGQLQQGQAPPMEDYAEFLRQRSDALAANEPPASQCVGSCPHPASRACAPALTRWHRCLCLKTRVFSQGAPFS